MTTPRLWWSARHGIITLQDGVWWRFDGHRTSLRHDGLPNELPPDAVPLVPVTRDAGRLTVTVDPEEAADDQA